MLRRRGRGLQVGRVGPLVEMHDMHAWYEHLVSASGSMVRGMGTHACCKMTPCTRWPQSWHKVGWIGSRNGFVILVLGFGFSFNGLWRFGHLGTRILGPIK